MSQDIRTYDLKRVDETANEARELSVTATVGPSPPRSEATRGVQLTMMDEGGYSYARLSEDQIRDLISVLLTRIGDNNDRYEASGIEAEEKTVKIDGTVLP